MLSYEMWNQKILKSNLEDLESIIAEYSFNEMKVKVGHMQFLNIMEQIPTIHDCSVNPESVLQSTV